MFLLAFKLKHFSSWIELILSVHQFFFDNSKIQNHVFNVFIPELLSDVQIFQCLLYICTSESILTLGTTHRLQIILWSVHLNAFLAQRVDLLRQVVYFMPGHGFRILQVFCHRIQVLVFCFKLFYSLGHLHHLFVIRYNLSLLAILFNVIKEGIFFLHKLIDLGSMFVNLSSHAIHTVFSLWLVQLLFSLFFIFKLVFKFVDFLLECLGLPKSLFSPLSGVN